MEPWMIQGGGLTSLESRCPQALWGPGLLSLSRLRTASQGRLASCFQVRTTPSYLKASFLGRAGRDPKARPLSYPSSLPHSPVAVHHSSSISPTW